MPSLTGLVHSLAQLPGAEGAGRLSDAPNGAWPDKTGKCGDRRDVPRFSPSQICPVSRKLGNVPSVPKFPCPQVPSSSAKITNSQNIDTVVSLDGFGNPTTDFGGFSQLNYLDSGSWLGLLGSTAVEVGGNTMWADLVSNAFPVGNLYFQRSAVPVLDSKTNDTVKSMLKTISGSLKASNCAKVFSIGLAGAPALVNNPYSFDQGITKGTKTTNYFDLTNSSTGNLTRSQITGGEDPNTETLTQYFPTGGNALTTNNSGPQYNHTAVVFAAGVLAWQNQSSAKPKYTLVHEVFLHAYAALSDSAVFADSVFQQNGLLNSSQSSSTNISNWVSTDCKCTPGISTGTCNMNSANW